MSGTTAITGTSADTGARTEEAARAVTGARARIDDLDARIIALIHERVELSARIQRDRIASGGRRVNLSRETRVLERYHQEFGRAGTSLAMTMLELCRGRTL